MLSKKLVEVLGWLAQPDELMKRCEDDTSRTRRQKNPACVKESARVVARLKEELALVRSHLNSAAELFVFLEGLNDPASDSDDQEFSWCLARKASPDGQYLFLFPSRGEEIVKEQSRATAARRPQPVSGTRPRGEKEEER